MGMVRPRVLDDDQILDRLADFLDARDSLGEWTLADAGRRIGMSPAGLIRRFGSRDGLLAALSTRWIATIPTEPRGEGPPEAELRAWVAGSAASSDSEAPRTADLVNLVTDLSDPHLTSLLRDGWQRERDYLAQLLAQLDLSRLDDPHVGSAVLVDALVGARLRRCADDAEHTDPEQILETLLEAWA